MDLKQKKLSKSEWNSIEILVSENETDVLKLITRGYHDVNIKTNKTESLFTYLKIECNSSLEDYLFNKYFSDKIRALIEKFNLSYIQLNTSKKQQAQSGENYIINIGSIVKLKSIDQVRVSRFDIIDETISENIYEYILVNHLESMLKYIKREDNKWHFHYYTLNKLLQNNVEKIIHYIRDICNIVLSKTEENVNLLYVLKHSSDMIEKNKNLLKFADMTLYNHQKQLFTAMKQSGSKLVLYIAPTSTGKTVSPLGLSEGHRIIFVCAVRHVGLSLARSAISINKKIAFAFGCSSTSDIRLHYFAATDYTKDRKSGKIRKVNNAIGDKVEIMICDVRSYLHAMYYMLAFNEAKNIITYWDEPTISMDYEKHGLHKIIKKNWKENIIPNVVLSSATLPKLNELELTIDDFKTRFIEDGVIPNIINIVSHDCRKTIPLIDNNGYIVMPHYLYENYDQVLDVVHHCEENLTLLRYIDLQEASNFCLYVEKNNCATRACKFERNFATINDIDMQSIKIYYLKLLKNIPTNKWEQVYNHFATSRNRKIQINTTVDLKGNKPKTSISKMNSVGPGISPSTTAEQQINNVGMYITTRDAYTLTDGPTIFIANDLQKIAKFYIKQSNIPASVMTDIQHKLDLNSEINERIHQLEKDIEFEENKIVSKLGLDDGKKNKKVNKIDNRQISQMSEQVNNLKSIIKRATIDDMFIPNKLTHINKWAEGIPNTSRAFTSSIDDNIIESIMLLKNVDDSWKILLLLGIGIFTTHRSSEYSEIMKQLADRQKLYLIIADSDYIYGTNYQFCHGYLGKDLDLTQEKIIQSLGRIGRSNIQQEYTVRFRDESQINMLFKHLEFSEKPEVVNMNILFNSKNIKWNKETQEYEDDVEENLNDDINYYDNDNESDEDENDNVNNDDNIINENVDDSPPSAKRDVNEVDEE